MKKDTEATETGDTMNTPSADKQYQIRNRFQTMNAGDLVTILSATKADSWMADIIRTEMANRGLDRHCRWIGHKEAASYWLER